MPPFSFLMALRFNMSLRARRQTGVAIPQENQKSKIKNQNDTAKVKTLNPKSEILNNIKCSKSQIQNRFEL